MWLIIPKEGRGEDWQSWAGSDVDTLTVAVGCVRKEHDLLQGPVRYKFADLWKDLPDLAILVVNPMNFECIADRISPSRVWVHFGGDLSNVIFELKEQWAQRAKLLPGDKARSWPVLPFTTGDVPWREAMRRVRESISARKAPSLADLDQAWNIADAFINRHVAVSLLSAMNVLYVECELAGANAEGAMAAWRERNCAEFDRFQRHYPSDCKASSETPQTPTEALFYACCALIGAVEDAGASSGFMDAYRRASELATDQMLVRKPLPGARIARGEGA